MARRFRLPTVDAAINPFHCRHSTKIHDTSKPKLALRWFGNLVDVWQCVREVIKRGRGAFGGVGDCVLLSVFSSRVLWGQLENAGTADHGEGPSTAILTSILLALTTSDY